MPATFPSHAAAVLAFKLRWPHRFDGVALVVGSAAPDLRYALNGFVVMPATHNLPALLWFCLPVTVVAAWLVRWAAPMVAAHLPTRPRFLAPRDYGLLGRVRHRWYVTAWSALLGAASHLVWDGFTHDPAWTHGWGAALVPALATEVGPGWPLWRVLQRASTVLGAAIALAAAGYLGRRRLLRAWHGEPAAVRRAPWVFWPVVAAALAVYPVTWPMLPYQWAPYVQGVRMIWAVALALLAGAAAVRLRGFTAAKPMGKRVGVEDRDARRYRTPGPAPEPHSVRCRARGGGAQPAP